MKLRPRQSVRDGRGGGTRIRWRTARAAALLVGVLALAPAPAQVAFGSRTQIWPFLFREPTRYSADEAMKHEVALGNLERYRELGATWNIVDVWQELDGPDGYRRLDRVIAEHDRGGIQVALRLLETPEIYDRIAAGGDESSAALGEYRAWVAGIARHVGPQARYYMISNEADHDIGYNRPTYRPFRTIRPSEYRELLQAGYAGVHGVDPALVVADQGTSSYTLALAVMNDMAMTGRPGEALEFWRGMDYDAPGETERTMPRLVAMLASGESRRRIDFAREVTGGLRAWRDVFQFHHYYGPAVLPATLRWIRAQGVTEPVVAAEVGFQVPAKRGKSWDGRTINVADMSRYSESAHAASLAGTVAALAGNGVRDILYWQIRFHVAHGPAASLYLPTATRDDFRVTRAVVVFRQLTRELTGARPVTTPALLREAGFEEFRFRRDGEFSIAWSPGAARPLPPAVHDRIARFTDAAGRPLDAAAPGTVVGAEPVFVFWRPGGNDP